MGVDSHDLSWHFADGTAGDVRTDSATSYLNNSFWSKNIKRTDRIHHLGHRLGSAQPEAVVVPAAEVADTVQVAEHEGHRVELGETRASLAEVLSAGSAIAHHVKEGVASPERRGATRALGHLGGLGVLGEGEASARGPASRASWVAGGSWISGQACSSLYSCLTAIAAGSFDSGQTGQARVAGLAVGSRVTRLSRWARKSYKFNN